MSDEDPTRRVSRQTDDDPTRPVSPSSGSRDDTDATRRIRTDSDERLLDERYAVIGRLGEGGMADVLRARDRQLDREVAIKVLHARYSRDPAFLERFQREARAVARLNHPHIVAVYDTGDDDGRPYIVMELVDGPSLKDEVRSGRLSVEQTLRLMSDAALALDYAHERGLVHRDVKPANLMLTADGTVKVTDFGIARAVDTETVTQTAAVFGTAAYMSPEQIRSQPVDRRTDVYALGCVLYEALTGRQPFTADNAVALAHKHLAEAPAPPSTVAPVDPALDAVVLTAMAKDPDQRYQTARELAGDLRRALDGLPLAAAAWADSTRALSHSEPTRVSAPPAEYDDAWDEEPGRGRRGFAYALLAISVLAAVGLIGWWLSTLVVEEAPELVAIPDLQGATEQEARDELSELGLVPVLGDRVFDDEIAEDRVVTTDPPAGDEVEEGSEVELVLSDGPETVQVPQGLVGRPEDEVRDLLAEAGLRVGERSEAPSDDVAEDSVISTDPPGGTSVPLDSEVDLVVSSGPDTVTMPDVVGSQESDAVAELEGACDDPDPCLVVNISRQFDPDAPEDEVIEQSPEADRQIRPGSSVVIVVSRGPEETPTTEPPPTEPPEPEPTDEPEPEPTDEPDATDEPAGDG